MNRAERRRQKREQNKKTPVYNFTQEQINSLVTTKVLDTKKQVSEEIIDKVLDDFLAITLMVLFDKFDFDKEALIKFKSCVDSLSDGVTEDYCSIEDFKLTLIEELGINLLKGKGENQDIEFEKLNNHKRRILNSGIWICYASILSNLKELYRFGNKRNTLLTEPVARDIRKHIEDPKSFSEILKEFSKNKDFEGGFSIMKDLLKENNDEVNNNEEAKKDHTS